MGDEEFVRWVDLLQRRTGVVVPPDRKTFLVTGLRMRMRETGYASFDTYFDQVLNGARGAIEWATLVDRLTVHETRFFRHSPSLDLIAEEWLPAHAARAPARVECRLDRRRSLFAGDDLDHKLRALMPARCISASRDTATCARGRPVR
jgi:hypothetical protein